jgi:predicted fused transcriptional regulator/phosphomethylpyrimidine kinase
MAEGGVDDADRVAAVIVSPGAEHHCAQLVITIIALAYEVRSGRGIAATLRISSSQA